MKYMLIAATLAALILSGCSRSATVCLPNTVPSRGLVPRAPVCVAPTSVAPVANIGADITIGEDVPVPSERVIRRY